MHKHELIHPYTEVGVEQLLRDIYKLENDETFRGDYAAVILRCDLESALQSHALTPRQRQAIALYYYCQLTQDECAMVLGVHRVNVGRRVDNAVASIARHMQGENVSVPQSVWDTDYTAVGMSHTMWMDEVLHNADHWWIVSDAVLLDINDMVGVPSRDDEVNEDKGEYPYKLSDEPLRPKREVLMREPYNRPKAITKTQKQYDETLDDDDIVNAKTKPVYVRYPNDAKVKRYGKFWTERA